MRPALPRRERDAGGADDLVGPQETLPVSEKKALGAGRVEPGQLFVKPDVAQNPIEVASLLANRIGDFGNRRQPILDCAEVQPGSADEDWHPARSRRCGDCVERQITPVADRAALGSIEIAVQLM